MRWVRGREYEVFRFRYEPSANRILMNIAGVDRVVVEVCDAAAVVATLPYVELAPEAKGEASLDVLHRLFEGNIRGGSQQEMSVIGHDDERV